MSYSPIAGQVLALIKLMAVPGVRFKFLLFATNKPWLGIRPTSRSKQRFNLSVKDKNDEPTAMIAMAVAALASVARPSFCGRSSHVLYSALKSFRGVCTGG